MRLQLDEAQLAELRKRLGNPKRVESAIRIAVAKEAQWLRKKMVEGLKSGAPAGQQLAPNAPSTRLLKGSSKPLIKSATMLNSIAVIRKGKGVFIGIKRKTRKGVNLAILHEKGAVIRQTVTSRQRRFLMMLSQRMFGRMFAPRVGAQIQIRIPARPFITPVMEKEVPTLQRRILKTFATDLLGGDFGRP